ncbi:MAG: hypothetical protein ACI8PB_003900 [Desulforhopalus sp.]|jgi:hypothetical protein
MNEATKFSLVALFILKHFTLYTYPADTWGTSSNGIRQWMFQSQEAQQVREQ